MNAVLRSACARHVGQYLLCLLILICSIGSAVANSQVSDEQMYEQAQLHMRNGETK